MTIMTTKFDIARDVEDKLDFLDLKHSKIVVDAVLESISERLENGEDLTFRGIGTLRHYESKQKVGQNIKKREAVIIPPKNKIKFVASEKLMAKINYTGVLEDPMK